MKINYNKESESSYPTFDSLSLTDTFFLLSEWKKNNDYPTVYMVIEECLTDEQGDDAINAVGLNDGMCIYVQNDAKVIPLDASLSISKKLVF